MRTDSSLLRTMNERRVMNELRRSGQLTRSQIAERIHVAFPTVLRVVDSLLTKGWVREVGLASSNGGRRPQVLEIAPLGGCAIGVELGRRTVNMVCLDLLSNVQSKERIALQDVQPRATLIARISQFIEYSVGDAGECLGIGIATPFQDPSGTTIPDVLELPRDWYRSDLIAELRETLQLPVMVGNDADLAALGEYWGGSQADWSPLLFVLIDIGIGAGLVHDGTVYLGARHAFGEISEMIVERPDPLEEVRVENTLDSASPPYIRQMIGTRRRVGKSETLADFFCRADAGLEPDREVLDRALDVLSVGLSNLASILDPAVLILGGDLLFAVPNGFRRIRDRYVRLQPDRSDVIRLAHHREDAVAVGAGALILQHVFDATLLVPPYPSGPVRTPVG